MYYNEAGVRIEDASRRAAGAPLGPLGGVFGLGGAASVISQTHHHTTTMFKALQSLFSNQFWETMELFLPQLKWLLEELERY